LIKLPPQKLYPQGFCGAPQVLAGGGGGGGGGGAAIGAAVGAAVGTAVGVGVGVTVGVGVGMAVGVSVGCGVCSAITEEVGVGDEVTGSWATDPPLGRYRMATAPILATSTRVAMTPTATTQIEIGPPPFSGV
jgi:hypothetical protein